MVKTPRTRVARAFLLLAAVLAVLMVFPGYAIANRVEPFVFGMPFGLFWIVLLQAIGFVGLCGLYLYERAAAGDES